MRERDIERERNMRNGVGEIRSMGKIAGAEGLMKIRKNI